MGKEQSKPSSLLKEGQRSRLSAASLSQHTEASSSQPGPMQRHKGETEVRKLSDRRQLITQEDTGIFEHSGLVVPVISDDHPMQEQFRLLREYADQQPGINVYDKDPNANMMLPLDSTSGFSYKPLLDGEIRLVALHPRPPFGPTDLMCSLLHIQLDDGPGHEYEAVSYSWGDPTFLHPVRCNYGQIVTQDGSVYSLFPLKSNESIKVSANLKAALLRLRLEDDYRVLWIDAICINQGDIQERSSQVQRMARIYASAKRVTIWLDEEDEQTELAFNCIDRLNEMKDWLLRTYPDPMTAENIPDVGLLPWQFESSSPGYFDYPTWEAFRSIFLKRTWFMRAWVFQEVVTAQAACIVCGSHIRDWDNFYQACILVSTFRMYNLDRALQHLEGTEGASVMIQEVIQMGQTRLALLNVASARTTENFDNYFKNVRFERLLMAIRMCDATNPKDKVYAVLSLAVGANLPRVDYSLSVGEIYTQVAKYWIQTNLEVSENITALLCTVQMANPKHQLPSWVTDWSSPLVAPTIADDGDFRAAGDSKVSMRFVPLVSQTCAFKPTELHFLDFKVGEATDFFPSREERLSVTGYINTSLAVKAVVILKVDAAQRRKTRSTKTKHAEIISRFQDPYPMTTKPYLEIYSRVINPQCPEDFCRIPENGTPGFWEYVKQFEQSGHNVEKFNERFEESGESTSRYKQEDMDRTLPSLFPAIGALDGPFGPFVRTFFVSTNGFMGIGPFRMAAGDEVAIFLGCSCPFVIRPTPIKGRYYFVGECSVFGIMNGEAMNGLDDAKIQELILD